MAKTTMLNITGSVVVQPAMPVIGADIPHDGRVTFAGVFGGTGTWSVTVAYAPIIDGAKILPERTMTFTNSIPSGGETLDVALSEFGARVSAVAGTVTSGKFYGAGA